MTPELYEAIKDVLNYNRVDSVQREAGMTGFVGKSYAARQRLERLEREFALHEPHRQTQTLVATWVSLRNESMYSQDARSAFRPATSMIKVKYNTWDGDRSNANESAGFEDYVRDITIPDLVGDTTGKKLFVSKVYSIPYAKIVLLDEKERAELYLKTPLKEDIFPELLKFWRSIGVNLAVDHLYILVDATSDVGILFWQVVAVTRKHIAASAPYEHNATLVSPPESKETVQPLASSEHEVLRGGVHISGIQDFTSLSPETLLGAIVSGISDPVTRASIVGKAVITALSPGVPLAALRDTKLHIVHEPRLDYQNVHDLVVENIANKKARIILSHVYCKETASFLLNDAAGVLAVVLGAPCGDLQKFYEKEILCKQGVCRIHQLVLLIKSGEMNDWTLAATLSEEVKS